MDRWIVLEVFFITKVYSLSAHSEKSNCEKTTLRLYSVEESASEEKARENERTKVVFSIYYNAPAHGHL